MSFVVLSWNTIEDTKVAIQNIRDQDYANKEIVVVDNGSDDGSKDYLSTLDDITYIDLPENTGFTGGQITALKACTGDYVMLLNSDAVLAKDWTKLAVDIFESEEEVAAVGGKVFEWDETDKAYDTTVPFYSYQKIDLNLGYASTLRTGESRVEVDSISGAAVMISMAIIKKLGYFDDAFFAYFEETDLFARYQKAGFKIIYEPSLHAWHQIAKSSKSKPYFYLYHMHRNRFMYGYKNFDHPGRFLAEYTADYMRAKRRYPKSRELDDKARIDAYAWNMKHLSQTIRKRRGLPKGSYDDTIARHHLGNDVTVIIPSYNYADYLPDAIESALNQTVKPYRVIVIDDGSSDNSVEIAQKYKGVEVVAKKNEGVILTKNLGIKMASTSWILFLDADDVLEPNYIEEMLHEAKKRPTDVVYCDMEYIGSKSGVFRAIEFSVDKLTEGNFIHNSSLINCSLIKSTGGFKPEMKGGYEDWELYLSLAEAGASFAYCRDTHLKYRQHGESLGRNNEATKNANALLEQVKGLHAPLYDRAHRNKQKTVKAARLLMRNPEVVIVAVAMVPVAAVLALKDYARGIKHRSIHKTRAYIHRKDSRKKTIGR